MRGEMEALQRRLRDRTAGPLEKDKGENTASQLGSAMQTDEIARLKVISKCIFVYMCAVCLNPVKYELLLS